jgi:hypothetical protein
MTQSALTTSIIVSEGTEVLNGAKPVYGGDVDAIPQ